FTTTLLGNYMPVTWLSYAVDYQFWGLRASGYHLSNNLLHAADAALFFWLALLLLRRSLPERSETARALGAAIAALVFAIHPLRAESVSWVTERKDVLAAFFLFLAVICYLKYATVARHRRSLFAGSQVLLALSLLSKVWGMTMPLVLLVLDVYPL